MLTREDPESLRFRVRNVLLNDWDPHNAARLESAHSTYDGYIPPILQLLNSGADEEALMDFLHEREKESMCFPSLGRQRLQRVAQKLIALRSSSPRGGP